MKIGMVSEFYYPQPGGISEHIRALSEELRHFGHEVVVLTSEIRGAIPEAGPRVIRLGRSLPLLYNGSLSRITVGAGLSDRFRRIVREERFDVLHLHNPLMPSLPLLALSQASCPMVATFHSAYRRDRWAGLFRRPLGTLLDRLEIRIAVSLSAQRAVGRLFPAEYRIIPNGVDFGSYARRAETAGRDSSRAHLLFVGAMVRRKGLPDLIDAFARVRGRRGGVDLWVVGDGPEAFRARRRVPERLRGDVRFLGFLPRHQLVGLYGEADIFCAPSLGQESFGMVLLEAMAAGLPIVASDIEGYRDVLTHGREGLLVPPRDPEALSEVLSWLLESPEECAAFGRQGRLRAAQHGWKEIARQVDAVYHAALGLRVPGLPFRSEAAEHSRPLASRGATGDLA